MLTFFRPATKTWTKRGKTLRSNQQVTLNKNAYLYAFTIINHNIKLFTKKRPKTNLSKTKKTNPLYLDGKCS